MTPSSVRRSIEAEVFDVTHRAVFCLVLHGLKHKHSTAESIRAELLGATREAAGWFEPYCGETLTAVIQRAIAEALAYYETECAGGDSRGG